MNDFDVIIVGYGPTGKVLATLLVEQGHTVAIVERWPEAYPLPRAVGYDHEIKRMMHSLDLADEVEKISRPMHHYVWYNAKWETLIDIDQSLESPSGGSLGYLFNQPELETVLDINLKKKPGVTYFLGYEAIQVQQTENQAKLHIVPFDAENECASSEEEQIISASYIVGCDGANSIIRQKIGSQVIDHGFDAHWLVVDVLPHDISDLPIPDAAQWCNPARPTTIVPSGIKNRRWEFMLLPGETVAEMEGEDKTWELLAHWIKPDEGVLVRSAVYRFRSLLMTDWRDQRLLIAGDAAHLMPPFMGQGMCSGLRDSWNLAWRLNLVLKNICKDSLLDSYELERSAHVDQVIKMSMGMGKVVCVSDVEEARQRDQAFFAGKVPPPEPMPNIESGLVRKNDNGELGYLAGVLLPHVELEKNGKKVRLDTISGRNFVLLINQNDFEGIAEISKAALERLSVKIILLGEDSYKDTEGRLDDFMHTNDISAIIARPDFYSFGTAQSSEGITGLIDAFILSIMGK